MSVLSTPTGMLKGRINRGDLRAKLLAGGATPLLWMARAGDTITSVSEDSNASIITWDGDISGRQTRSNRMSLQSFNGANQWGSVPDLQSLSFGNGATDLAFTMLSFSRTGSSGSNKEMITKLDPTNREYVFGVNGSGLLFAQLYDNSVPIGVTITSNAAVPTDIPHLFWWTYDGRGGATAADGMTLGMDGAVLATTPANAGTYVAMEDLNAPVELGSLNTHSAQFFLGSKGMDCMYSGVVLPLTRIQAIRRWLTSAYGVR